VLSFLLIFLLVVVTTVDAHYLWYHSWRVCRPCDEDNVDDTGVDDDVVFLFFLFFFLFFFTLFFVSLSSSGALAIAFVVEAYWDHISDKLRYFLPSVSLPPRSDAFLLRPLLELLDAAFVFAFDT